MGGTRQGRFPVALSDMVAGTQNAGGEARRSRFQSTARRQGKLCVNVAKVPVLRITPYKKSFIQFYQKVYFSFQYLSHT